jgi:uncharacterized protein YbjT (DUF2867 family)
MRVLLFGATGMIGLGVLRECLADPEVEAVLGVGRSTAGVRDPKLREIVQRELWDYSAIAEELTGWDACFFCLGVSSSSVSEAEYERITYGITMAAAEVLARLNPRMVFIYVSGAGTDSTEKGRLRWARVKGRTENAILRLPFREAYAFRPAGVQPVHGERSKTALYRMFYVAMAPLWPLLRRVLPGYIVTTAEIGRAMLYVVRHGAPKRVLESADIRECARRDANLNS